VKILQHQDGFTLLEVLIAVAIVGLMMTLAYPSYREYLTKARRTEAQLALLNVATRLENFYMNNHCSFKEATLQKLNSPSITPNGLYALELTQQTDSTYLLRAKPLGTQAKNDSACDTLTLNQAGQENSTGNAPSRLCWR